MHSFYISGGEVNELGSVLMELGVMFLLSSASCAKKNKLVSTFYTCRPG